MFVPWWDAGGELAGDGGDRSCDALYRVSDTAGGYRGDLAHQSDESISFWIDIKDTGVGVIYI